MASEARSGVTGGVPELRETRVEVEVSFAPQAAQQRLQGQVPGDVDEEVGRFGDLQELCIGKAMNLLATLVYQRGRAGQAELFRDLLEIGKVYGVFEGGDGAGSIDAAFSADLLHEVDAKSELLQPSTQLRTAQALPPLKGLLAITLLTTTVVI